jgi:hypothetical protein
MLVRWLHEQQLHNFLSILGMQSKGTLIHEEAVSVQTQTQNVEVRTSINWTIWGWTSAWCCKICRSVRLVTCHTIKVMTLNFRLLFLPGCVSNTSAFMHGKLLLVMVDAPEIQGRCCFKTCAGFEVLLASVVV